MKLLVRKIFSIDMSIKCVVSLSLIIAIFLASSILPGHFNYLWAQREQDTKSTNQTASGFNVYQDELTGIKLVYPSNWARVDVPQSVDRVVTFYAPPTGPPGSFLANLAISKGKYAQKMSTDEFIDWKISELKNSTDVKIIEADNKFNISGQPAFRVVYTFDIGGNQYRAMRIGVLVNSSFYVVTYIAEDSKFSDYEDVVNRMIKSLRIPPETSSSSDQEYVYRDPKTETKMTLKYPSTWILAQQGYSSSNITFYPPLDNVSDNYLDNLRIYINKLSNRNISLEIAYQALINALDRGLDQVNLTKTNYVNISNLSSIGVVYSYPVDGIIHKFLSTVTIKEGNQYLIVFDTTPAKFNQYLPILKKIVSSIRIA